MKSGQFNSKKSQIRGTREKEAPKSTNWDRVVYLSLLTIAIVALIYFVGKANLFVSGDGRIVTNQLEVRSPSDIRIQKIYVQPGDSVLKSDTLFQFTFLEWNQTIDSLDNLKKRILQYQDDLDKVQGDLRLKQKELDQARSELIYYQDRLEMVKREIRLGVASVSDLKSIEDRLVSLRTKVENSNEQASLIRQQRNRLQALIADPYANEGSEALKKVQTMKMIFSSPVEGVVTAVHKNDTELGLKSERVITILSENTNLKVQAIFDQEDGKHLNIGDKMNVSFDNGQKSSGIITDIYAAESVVDRPSSSSNNALKFSIQLIAELKPENAQELKTWKANNKMGVTVTKTVF
ncbi:HlyD family secretion protein [Balneola sp. MJW-20]|uniref:HlyD family secretion protein n=1 Tax=Gracilimonas aurantiaca TaxID=3234185 RepID=UPI00346520BE